mgnify:CR=1 FL=1
MTPTSKQRADASQPKRSAQEAAAHVTAEITRFLERGVMPWRVPWDAARAYAATPGMPLRATGEAYRGANVVLLWAAQAARGYGRRTWLTYKQAEALGAQVRKGEKACPVIYYGSAPVRHGAASREPDPDGKTYRFLKLFHVFNVEQIENLPPDFGAEVAAEPSELPAISEWVRGAGATIRMGGARAFYSPITDAIHMPPLQAFDNEEAWSATLAHEAIHFTGHSSRLDRLSDYARDQKARAREELVAETGTAMLGAMLGFRPDHMEDHAAYIGDWLALLQDEPRAFLSAAAKAQAAVDWLIAKTGGTPSAAVCQP